MKLLTALIMTLVIAASALAAFAQEDPTQWRAELDGIIYSADMSADGGVQLVGTRNDLATAFSPEGNVLWSFEAGSTVLGVGTSADGQWNVAASEDRNLYFLDAGGVEIWQFRSSRIFADTAISDDGSRIAASDEANMLYYLHSDSNEPVWEYTLRNMADSIDVFGAEDAHVVVGTRDSRVIHFDSGGEIVWDTQLAQQITSVAVNDDGSRVAASSLDGKVTMLDGTMGEIIWQVNMSVNCTTRNRLDCINLDMDGSGDRVLVATRDSEWHVMSGIDGSIQQTHSMNGMPTAVALSGDGLWLIVGNRDGVVAASTLAAAEEAYEQEQRARRNRIIGALAFVIVASTITTLWIRRTESGYHFWTVTMRPARRTVVNMWRSRVSYLMLVPTVVMLLVFNYYPAASGLYHSFTIWKPGVETTWVGFDQFREMSENRFFWAGVQNMLILAFAAFIKLSIPLLVAEFIFHIKWGSLQYFLRTLFIIPMVLPSVVGILLWVNIYDPNIGLLNNTLLALGADSWTRPWLGDRDIALWAIVAIGAPWVNPLALLIFYGGLIGIPQELFDAAKVDGSNAWTRFWRIDIPLLLGQIRLLVILAFIGSMQEFQLIFLTTGGGPGSATYTPALELYYQATRFNNFGLASAMGTFLFLIILGGTIINMRTIRSRTEYQA